MTDELLYNRNGDYLIPNLILTPMDPAEEGPLGKYALMRKSFLKEYRTVAYNTMLLNGTLFPHLRDTDWTANNRAERIMTELTAKNPPPDKAEDSMAWAAAMDAMKAQAEEIVLKELIYI